MKSFNFNDLFIFDIANNHQGDVKHGLNIIKAVGKVTKEAKVRGSLKFQFRQVDTFIHPEFKDKKDIAHIPRFISTYLSKKEYQTLLDEVRKQGLIAMCTPFDEESVDIIIDMNFDVIKVASCSADDQPLLERIVGAGKPVIVSTAGFTFNNIDSLVSYFEYKRIDFALMHCVALYPTKNEELRLNQIEVLKSRYPNIPIGFSTHENPDNLDAIKVAFAKGARLFERHVGLNTGKYKLNQYSSIPEQLRKWIDAFKKAVDACGGEEWSPSFVTEVESLESLKRGVYAKKKIKKGSTVKRSDVFFAMPLMKSQLRSSDWSKNLVADKIYSKNQALNNSLKKIHDSDDDRIYQIMLQVKGMLNNARIFIGKDSSIEISHHYGLRRFREFGAVIVDCINRQYCKKIIIQLPRQKHPVHFHKKKEETFQLLYGDLEIVLDGHRYKMVPGDTLLVKPNQWHKFHTLDGAIMEEISTTHYNNDSIYEDELITQLPRKERKTIISNWEAAIRQEL